jgi:hypothetical protein
MTRAVTERYTEEHTDFIAGVVVDTGDIYWFPVSVDVKAVIQVNPKCSTSRAPNRKVEPENYRNILHLGDDTFLFNGR